MEKIQLKHEGIKELYEAFGITAERNEEMEKDQIEFDKQSETGHNLLQRIEFVVNHEGYTEKEKIYMCLSVHRHSIMENPMALLAGMVGK